MRLALPLVSPSLVPLFLAVRQRLRAVVSLRRQPSTDARRPPLAQVEDDLPDDDGDGADDAAGDSDSSDVTKDKLVKAKKPKGAAGKKAPAKKASAVKGKK